MLILIDRAFVDKHLEDAISDAIELHDRSCEGDGLSIHDATMLLNGEIEAAELVDDYATRIRARHAAEEAEREPAAKLRAAAEEARRAHDKLVTQRRSAAIAEMASCRHANLCRR